MGPISQLFASFSAPPHHWHLPCLPAGDNAASPKHIPHNIWVQNPSFTMEDFKGPMEEEVPCADYHVQAPAVSFFGGVYLKFKFSDLQSRHPIKSWKHLKYWNKTWELKINYISRKMKTKHLKQSGSFQNKSVVLTARSQIRWSQPIPKVTLNRVPNNHQRWRGSPPKKRYSSKGDPEKSRLQWIILFPKMEC